MPPARIASRLVRGLLSLLSLLVLGAAVAGAAVTAAAPEAGAVTALTPAPLAPAGLPLMIEPLARYVGQDSCTPGFRRGTLALGQLLVRTYPNTTFGGDYACGTDGHQSEHYEGRAIDWMDSVRDPTQRAQAAAVLKFLLGTDSHGNMNANARRLGLMYVIWNNNIWGSWNQQWQPYDSCARTPQAAYDSACHRNHMHISLSWNGAMGRTSFWTGKVFIATDYGPCRVAGLNWARGYAVFNPRPCPPVRGLSAPANSSAGVKALVAYSGVGMPAGFRGPAIAAVQHAFNLAETATLDGRTVAVLNAFKRRHQLPADGKVTEPTWRALIAVYAPRAK